MISLASGLSGDLTGFRNLKKNTIKKIQKYNISYWLNLVKLMKVILVL